MDYRGTAIVGVWLGMAGIIGIFSYSELAGASLWLVFAALMMTAHILRQRPEGESIDKLSEDLTDFTKRLSSLEENVGQIKRLLEE
ncbi:hypothetical protein KAV47_03275 [Candidatus Bathyarchaeota archaeon]|jgi:hypothetical protein|nr:hypothetical protein [Candidatus Bathyarchaeota archaeon]